MKSLIQKEVCLKIVFFCVPFGQKSVIITWHYCCAYDIMFQFSEKKVSTGFIYVHYMTDYDLSNWSWYAWNACCLFHSGIFCAIPKVFDQWQSKIVHIPGRQKDNPCRAGPGSFRTNYVNVMAEDDLAPSVARSSSAMVLTMCDRQNAVFLEEGFWLHVPFHTNMHLCFLKKTSP